MPVTLIDFLRCLVGRHQFVSSWNDSMRVCQRCGCVQRRVWQGGIAVWRMPIDIRVFVYEVQVALR